MINTTNLSAGAGEAHMPPCPPMSGLHLFIVQPVGDGPQ
jgi:hypothetical protein